MKISPSEVTRAPIDLVVYYNPPPKVIDQRLFEIGNLGPISSCKVGEDCGSFHLPIHVSINIGISKLPTKLIRPLKNIDWDEFKDSLREKGFNFTEESLNYNCENIDRAICNLTDNTGSTLDKVCPKRPTINRNWWKFTPEIAKLMKVKRKIRRMLKEDPFQV